MWVAQLEKERTVGAQLEAIAALRRRPASSSQSALMACLANGKQVFWRVRVEAAEALIACSPESRRQAAGLDTLLHFARERCFDSRTGLPRPNDFRNWAEHLVNRALPGSVASARGDDGCSPPEALQFLLALLKHNDNSRNAFSDSRWLAVILQAVGNVQLGPQEAATGAALFKQVHRYLLADSHLPRDNGVVARSALVALARLALRPQCTVRERQRLQLLFRALAQGQGQGEGRSALSGPASGAAEAPDPKRLGGPPTPSAGVRLTAAEGAVALLLHEGRQGDAAAPARALHFALSWLVQEEARREAMKGGAKLLAFLEQEWRRGPSERSLPGLGPFLVHLLALVRSAARAELRDAANGLLQALAGRSWRLERAHKSGPRGQKGTQLQQRSPHPGGPWGQKAGGGGVEPAGSGGGLTVRFSRPPLKFKLNKGAALAAQEAAAGKQKSGHGRALEGPSPAPLPGQPLPLPGLADTDTDWGGERSAAVLCGASPSPTASSSASLAAAAGKEGRGEDEPDAPRKLLQGPRPGQRGPEAGPCQERQEEDEEEERGGPAGKCSAQEGDEGGEAAASAGEGMPRSPERLGADAREEASGAEGPNGRKRKRHSAGEDDTSALSADPEGL
eukprot:TRINITY_DN339_c0_g1_i2.p1 TRINITY_DN339_c0_g1~~TRINITY_DN339_c0_g1_i2.p1  ORF type:complete len:683 (-),score=195.45 TRINITY_DN339_c0_g1_i2:2383-4251(-)